jgi:hypothetical protein
VLEEVQPRVDGDLRHVGLIAEERVHRLDDLLAADGGKYQGDFFIDWGRETDCGERLRVWPVGIHRHRLNGYSCCQARHRNQWAAAELPPSDQTRGTRDWSDPDRPVELAPPRRFHTELCMHARDPSRARPPRGDSRPPTRAPRIRAETSATSAERRRTRPPPKLHGHSHRCTVHREALFPRFSSW